MDYVSARDVADKWGISQRRVAVLCSEHRIAGAKMVGNMWIIPEDAKKPEDARTTRFNVNDGKGIKPFLKWAGGKGQLISEIERHYPFGDGKITKYAEPFVGGGAVLFDILNRFDLEEIYIGDINSELINTYNMVKNHVDELLELLFAYQREYIPLVTEERKHCYMLKRVRFNELKTGSDETANIEKAALMIFLNKTCFNGLYRVNKKGLFNVPMGSYKKPLICDETNLLKVSEKLKDVKIVCGDYTESENFIDEHTFAYFDPPYRPLTETASFTSYSEKGFDDNAQIKLAEFVNCMDEKGAKIIVSNSDPKNIDNDDNFFDKIYNKLEIISVNATRMINSNSKARGKISELLISNF